jgi:uncharacterized protein
MKPVEPVEGGVRITLHIQPRASVTELAGRHGDAIKLRIKSPPVDGAANQELLRFLAGALSVPLAQVELVSGHTGRRKTVRVAGLSVDHVERWLAGITTH